MALLHIPSRSGWPSGVRGCVQAFPVGAFPAAGVCPATEPTNRMTTAAAATKKRENQANWVMLDPETKCYLPGVPRITYLPHPFQIVQSQNVIMITYEYAGAVRVINMGAPTKPPAESWMGWSNGRWEGETLVVDVTSLNEDTWFDRAGNFHSDALHVVERYTSRSADTLNYEATIEDPKVFSRPWKISMPLYRRVEKDARLLEYKCVEFTEELLYGPLRKKASN